jgi:hypothetical protein
MRAKLDRDTQADDQIDQAQCIEADSPDAHDTHHVGDSERDDERDDDARAPGPEKNCHDEQNRRKTETEHFLRDVDYMRVLVKENVE